MAHQVIWTKKVTDFFFEAASLNELEKCVMRCRIANFSIVETAAYMNISTSTVSRIVARLKVKYDAVQREFPNELKPRRTCAVETYMDEH